MRAVGVRLQADHAIRTKAQLSAVLALLRAARADAQQEAAGQSAFTACERAGQNGAEGRDAEQSLRLLETLTYFFSVQREGRLHGVRRRTR